MRHCSMHGTVRRIADCAQKDRTTRWTTEFWPWISVTMKSVFWLFQKGLNSILLWNSCWLLSFSLSLSLSFFFVFWFMTYDYDVLFSLVGILRRLSSSQVRGHDITSPLLSWLNYFNVLIPLHLYPAEANQQQVTRYAASASVSYVVSCESVLNRIISYQIMPPIPVTYKQTIANNTVSVINYQWSVVIISYF